MITAMYSLLGRIIIPPRIRDPSRSFRPAWLSLSKIICSSWKPHHLTYKSTHQMGGERFSTSSTQRPKIVLTRDLGPEIMPLFDSNGPESYEVVVWPHDSACDRKWLLENAPGAAALIVLLTDKIDTELLDAAGPQLKVVSTMSVGYEHVNVKELVGRNIKLGYTPDVLTDAVADLSIMLALMAGRRAREAMEFVNESKWPTCDWAPFGFCGVQLSATKSSPRRVAGFLGFGRIAQATLSRLTPFGFSECVYASNPSSRPNPERDASLAQSLGLKSLQRVPLDNVAYLSDVVFVLTPGGSQTEHLVNEDFLRKMKKTAVLVNTSRGSVVDSAALAKALRERWIWAAGLDVVAGEPNISADHPLIKEPRCIVLPHVGSATLQTRLDMAALAVKNALAAIACLEMPAGAELGSS